MKIMQTEIFKKWAGVLDAQTRAIIDYNVEKLEKGNFSNVKSVGFGIHELKINFQKGYRIYFTNVNGEIILLLCAGDKSSQDRDIQKAKRLKETL